MRVHVCACMRLPLHSSYAPPPPPLCADAWTQQSTRPMPQARGSKLAWRRRLVAARSTDLITHAAIRQTAVDNTTVRIDSRPLVLVRCRRFMMWAGCALLFSTSRSSRACGQGFFFGSINRRTDEGRYIHQRACSCSRHTKEWTNDSCGGCRCG